MIPSQDSQYFSIDIETNGLVAGINSMISLGCAAFDVDTGEIISTFKVNIQPLPDLAVDASTMEFWSKFPEAYKIATDGAVHPKDAMRAFEEWVKCVACGEQPVCCAWKPGFDCAFVRYYLFRFLGHDIFGRAGSGLDIKTLTATALNQSFSKTQIATVPAEWRGRELHDHTALGDAIEQAHVFVQARKSLGVTI